MGVEMSGGGGVGWEKKLMMYCMVELPCLHSDMKDLYS